MTLAVPWRSNIPRPTKKDPKDTLEGAFNKLAWGFFNGMEGVDIPIFVERAFRSHEMSNVYGLCMAVVNRDQAVLVTNEINIYP